MPTYPLAEFDIKRLSAHPILSLGLEAPDPRDEFIDDLFREIDLVARPFLAKIVASEFW